MEYFLALVVIGILQDGNPMTLCVSGCGLFG